MKTSMACTLLAAALVCVTPLDSLAQVRQSGNVTPGHIATWTTTGVIQDGGGAVPSVVIPTVVNGLACFSNTTGTLTNCGNQVNVNGTFAITPTSNHLGLNITQTLTGSTFDVFGGNSGTASNVLDGIYVPSDNAAQGSFFYDFGVIHVFGGAAATGSRNPYLSWLVQSAVTSASNPQRYYTGGTAISDTRSGDGGTDTTSANAKGEYYGWNAQVRVGPSASNVRSATGLEVDNWGSTGGTLRHNWGLNIVSFTPLVGAGSDAGLIFYSAGSVTSGGITYGPGGGWAQGISFGEEASNGLAPLQTTGTVLGTHFETLSTFTVAHGIDLRGFTCTSKCYESVGYSVDGSGNILAPTLTLSQNAATPTLPPPNLASLWLLNIDGSGATAFADAYTNQAGGTGSTVISPLIIFRAANGTLASPSQLGATSVIGVFGARTYTSSSTFTSANVARIAFQTFNAQTNTDNSSLITLETTPSGSTTRAVAMTIQPSGGVSVGAAAADPGIGAINATNGYKSGGTAGVSTTCTVTAGNTLVFTGGILTSKGANCT